MYPFEMSKLEEENDRRCKKSDSVHFLILVQQKIIREKGN